MEILGTDFYDEKFLEDEDGGNKIEDSKMLNYVKFLPLFCVSSTFYAQKC